ncbi:MAG TPA: NADH-ubiquinone oxidoreductase-F iron-sulfur binding region domain-containing protein [Blastocatellia bacterium]
MFIEQGSPYVHVGPIIAGLVSRSARSLTDYKRAGGGHVLRKAIEIGPASVIAALDQAKLRGRAGGGYPASHKWWLVSRREESEKYFICNANSMQPGGFKEQFLINSSPHTIIEACAIAAHTVGAPAAFIFLPSHFGRELELLEASAAEWRESGWLTDETCGRGFVDVIPLRSPGRYISGEETALLEILEGRIGRPRGKPPLPTSKGAFGLPTVVNNLETVLNAYHILDVGPERYRQHGTVNSPGTLVFCLSGHVNRPGLYELPLGTTLRSLIFEHGQGVKDGESLKAVFPGGISSPVASPDMLDLPLDFDSVREAGSDLGSGSVIVVADGTCMVDLAGRLAEFFSEASCGKCHPCSEGTRRTATMIARLDGIDEKNADQPQRQLPPSQRTRNLPVIMQPAGISYTDTASGLDKIAHLAEFYKYRGDCHLPQEAANSIQSLLAKFCSEFEHHRNNTTCDFNFASRREPIYATTGTA